MENNKKWQRIRERRLHSDFRRLQDLARQSQFIKILKTEGNPPELYMIGFSCKGVAHLDFSDKPVYNEEHHVELFLPADYPTKMPQMRWLTPIFHPNINAEGTFVCIDVWYPTKFLDDLCIMLGRMIQYKNYNPYSAVRKEAARWSLMCPHFLPVDKRSLRHGISESNPSKDFEIRIL